MVITWIKHHTYNQVKNYSTEIQIIIEIYHASGNFRIIAPISGFRHEHIQAYKHQNGMKHFVIRKLTGI